MLEVQLLRYTHFAVLAFVVFGWAIPSTDVRITHLFVIPLLVFHWSTNQGACVLTQLEERLLRRPGLAVEHKNEGEFSRRLLEKALGGRKISDRALKWTIYGVMLVAWSLSLCFVSLG